MSTLQNVVLCHYRMPADPVNLLSIRGNTRRPVCTYEILVCATPLLFNGFPFNSHTKLCSCVRSKSIPARTSFGWIMTLCCFVLLKYRKIMKSLVRNSYFIQWISIDSHTSVTKVIVVQEGNHFGLGSVIAELWPFVVTLK